MGLTQGLLSTLVADAAPADLRGTAFGVFHLVSGVAMLLASVIAGALWDAYGAAWTFYAGAGVHRACVARAACGAKKLLKTPSAWSMPAASTSRCVTSRIGDRGSTRICLAFRKSPSCWACCGETFASTMLVLS